MSEPGPRRGKRAAWCLAIAGLAAVAVTGALAYPELDEWWHGIPVVHTWGDLLEQEPIDLGDGIKVRVGIEAKRAPLWSGVLVYCLAEGKGEWKFESEGWLGPLQLSVVEPGSPEGQRAARAASLRSLSALNHPDSRVLFAHAIPVTSTAPRRVELRSRGGKHWRFATVRTSRDAPHPWMPLDRPPKLRQLARDAPGEVPIAGVLAHHSDGIALPRYEGWQAQPSRVTEDGLANPDLPLPSLFPRSGEPRIALRQVGARLEIEAAEELSSSSPVDRFLARYWVNGQPYISQPRLPERIVIEGSGKERPGRTRLLLELELDPANLGARPGDRIGLQLLYLDGGWEHVGPAPGLEKLWRRDEPHRVLLTNRIELVAP